MPWRGEAAGPSAHPAPPAPLRPLLSPRPKLCLPRRLPLGGRPAMYQRMLRCGAELGSPGVGGGGGGGAGGRLALLWIVPLTLSGLLGVAWGASSLGAHHIHHFHGSSKHHSVPIAIYRSPASLRGGHGGSAMPSSRGLPPSLPPFYPALAPGLLWLREMGARQKGGAFGCAWCETLISLKTIERGWGKASRLLVVRGGRGVPCRGSGREMWASTKGPARVARLGPAGRGRHLPEGHSVAGWGAALS